MYFLIESECSYLCSTVLTISISLSSFLVDDWLRIGWWLIDGWIKIDYILIKWLLIDDWLMIDWWLIDDWLTIDWWLIDDWLTINWWLIDDWLMIISIVLYFHHFHSKKVLKKGNRSYLPNTEDLLYVFLKMWLFCKVLCCTCNTPFHRWTYPLQNQGCIF